MQLSSKSCSPLPHHCCYFCRHKTLDHALSNEFSGFHLRVVGHSLGAGIAAMLGLMLRQKYPSLMCLCFSPPGCVFTPRTAERSKAYAW